MLFKPFSYSDLVSILRARHVIQLSLLFNNMVSYFFQFKLICFEDGIFVSDEVKYTSKIKNVFLC